MTHHWINGFRPLTDEQYASASANCQSAYNDMTASIDELHTSGSGAYDNIEQAPFHERIYQLGRMNQFSKLWVEDGN